MLAECLGESRVPRSRIGTFVNMILRTKRVGSCGDATIESTPHAHREQQLFLISPAIR